MKRINLQVDDRLFDVIAKAAQYNNISINRFVLRCTMDALFLTPSGVLKDASLAVPKENERTEKERSKEKVKKDKETTHTHARTREEFVPPSFADCVEYREKHEALADTDIESFFAYYTTNGWTLPSGRVMRNWRSALVRWAKNDKLKVFARGDAKTAARDDKEKRDREKMHRERLEAARDPANWQLCAERCSNYHDGCTKGAKWPPQFNDRPIPPQECKHFLSVDKNK